MYTFHSFLWTKYKHLVSFGLLPQKKMQRKHREDKETMGGGESAGGRQHGFRNN